eukprot:COSAG02_NODE_4203_length_5629_cov_3.527667_1_plen_53_part_10
MAVAGIAGKQVSWFASVNVGSSVRVSKGIPPPGWYGLGVLAKVKYAILKLVFD